MTEVNRSGDCGNSPKNLFAENIAIAVELRDLAFLGETFAADAFWEVPDGSTAEGAAAILSHAAASEDAPDVLTIDRAISHGKVAAVNGTVETNGSVRRFCHVMEFATTSYKKVRRLASY